MKYALINMGSNSIRLTVYDLKKDGFQVLFKEKIMAGLAGYVEHGRLTQDGISCACQSLKEFLWRSVLITVPALLHPMPQSIVYPQRLVQRRTVFTFELRPQRLAGQSVDHTVAVVRFRRGLWNKILPAAFTPCDALFLLAEIKPTRSVASTWTRWAASTSMCSTRYWKPSPPT